MQKRIVILANSDVGLYNFRKELVKRLIDEGYVVIVSSPYGERINDLVKMGCKYIKATIARHGTNPREDLKLLAYYKKLISTIKPNAVLTYTIKPNIYGGMACAGLNIPYIANITGLGSAVEKNGLLQKITILLYKRAFRKVQCVFFQNTENRQFFIDRKIAIGKHKLLPGSGVNLEAHPFIEYPKEDNSLRFLFVGRIMKDKGVNELLEAARIIKEKYSDVHFDLIGFCEEDYENKATLDSCHQQGIVHYYGQQKDVNAFIQSHHAIILPTYHEGMANVLLEASACGRPVLASNIPGCQETFDEGISGLGFKPKDVNALVQTIEKFIGLSYDKKVAMGKAAHKKVKKEFNRQIVVDAYLEEIKGIEI